MTIFSVFLISMIYFQVKALLAPNLTVETVNRVHYLNSGWTKKDRETYYFTPQGTELLGLEYSWLVNLEMPLSRDMLASTDNMRGWGFIVEPGQQPSVMNPGNLPIGFGRHIDPKTQREKLDITCAACHTGELHYQGKALRVDGGQALHSISNAKRGEFILTLGVSVLLTYADPFKFNRFADRVVGENMDKRMKLRKDLNAFISKGAGFAMSAGNPKYYPVEEGRGRTDAVGRIGNVVFGYDIDEPGNLRVANAPVNYPFLWDMWRFDWVQYTGFTNQPMARNIGESLGVLAPVKLVDENGKLLRSDEFGETVIDLAGMHCVEGKLRTLEPPRWPEDILGDIDIAMATKGKNLFQQRCQYCHGPHRSESYQWPVASHEGSNPAHQNDVNWQWDMDGDISYEAGRAIRQDWREVIWALPWIDIKTIGTDATAANNYMDHKYDASKLIPGMNSVNAGDGLQILLNRLIPKLYQDDHIDKSLIPEYDGLNIPFRIVNKRAYKSRPLHGVWATPPFLHNGSVPSIYHLLSPQSERPQAFYVGNREYDPIHLGYVANIEQGAFLHDTKIEGNGNKGHLFTDADVKGRIGTLLSVKERMELIEYLKVLGNPDYDSALGGDPQNWNQYVKAPYFESEQRACEARFESAKSHPLEVL
ncbi:di-heme-cytochrome C peroxidase [Vibrio sp. S9_S30]|uniref:di-heme-cytochrome C peroxidase n=1 Tax=Vibrio sp. S9_S30 TaxID=2720226 RepID=UPI003138A7A4